MNKIVKANLLFEKMVNITDLFMKAFPTDEIAYRPQDEEGSYERIYFWYFITDPILGENVYDNLVALDNSIAYHNYKDDWYIGFTWYGIHWTQVEDFTDLAWAVIPDGWVKALDNKK